MKEVTLLLPLGSWPSYHLAGGQVGQVAREKSPPGLIAHLTRVNCPVGHDGLARSPS